MIPQRRHNNPFSRTLRSACLAIGMVCAIVTAMIAPSSNAHAIVLQGSADPAAYNAKGLEQFNSGKYEDAVKSFKEAIKLKKDYAEALYNLGDAYFKLNQFKQAVEAYKQALKYQPNSATIYNNLGTAHFKLREHKKATEAFKAAIRLDPKNGTSYYNLGATYVLRDNEKAALEQYRILKDIDVQQAHKLFLIIYKPMAGVFDAATGVRLNVTAIDAQGYLVSNLGPDDFQVLEDNLAQGSPSNNLHQKDSQIADIIPESITTFSKEAYPLIYGLIVDASGSMRAALQNAVDLAKTVIEAKRPDDEMLLVRFSESNQIETVLDFTSDEKSLTDGINTVYVTGGQSAVIDAVYLAAQRVAEYRPDHSPYLRRSLILITDGEERVSYYTLNQLVELLRKIDVQIFSICLSKNEFDSSQLNNTLAKAAVPLLTTLANETGGAAFFPKSVKELNSIARHIMARSRTQYLIGYKPAKPTEPLTYRRVTVKIVDKPGREKINSVVRPGYSVPQPKPTP